MERGRLTSSVVKPKLFEPTKDLRLSVFRASGLGCIEIKDAGKEVVRRHRNAKGLYGWGEVSEDAVGDTGLRINHDDIPRGHSNIINWPQDSAQRKLIQQRLASQSTAVKINPIQVSP